jgi:transposase, IS30 family
MSQHVTAEERDRIAQLHCRGASRKEIAEALGRHRTTIGRELRRNRTGGQYHAAQAQQLAEARRRDRPVMRRMDDPRIDEAVRGGLAADWSPGQIAGRLQREHPDEPRRRVSAQTIYDWIERNPHREHWRSHLRRRGKRPCRRKKAASPGAPIAGRPQEIEDRLRLGDFEGDTVLGPPGTGGLATLVDRKSRYTIVLKVQSKRADHVHARLRKRLKELHDERRRSITFDNGTEFARCGRLERHLGVRLYFADPGCPYQRGSNENTNGLIRQYFPKGTDFRDISHHEVRRVEGLLNRRPRQCLAFRTPDEVFFETHPPPGCD